MIVKKPLISIIVPVYNTEKYLKECLDSVVLQMNECVECIIVDDGSTDNSFEICEGVRCSNKHLKIVLIHQDNKGLSCARNTGIQAANGQFISFLDSDDYVAGNYIKSLTEAVQNSNEVDLFMYDAEVVNETNAPYLSEAYSRANMVPTKALDGKTFFSDWYLGKMVVSSCLCLFRRSFLVENGLFFTPGKLHEDISFSFRTLYYARKVMYISQKIYIRRVRNDSITTVCVGEKHFDGVLTAAEECLGLIQDRMALDKVMHIKKMQNAVDRYLCFWMDYLLAKCKESASDVQRLGGIYERMLDYFLSKSMYDTYSWAYAFSKLLCIIEKQEIHIQGKLLSKLLKKYKCESGLEICEHLGRIMTERRLDVVLGIPLDAPHLKIGIYGRGVHTERLLAEYKQYRTIVADYYYVESFVSGNEIVSSNLVYSVDEIPHDTDMIIISSWVYHNEMLLRLKEYANCRIFDLYETEKLPFYE